MVELCNIIGERGLISPEEDRVTVRENVHMTVADEFPS